MMSKTICALAAALLGALCVTGIRAQSTDQNEQSTLNQSTPSNPPVVPSADGTEATPDSAQQPSPDQHPLGGIQQLTLGNSSEPHSFLVPGISITTQLATYPHQSGNTGITSVNFLLGHVDLQHLSSHSELTLGYAGGGMLSTTYYGAGNVNSVIQDLRFYDNFKWEHWSLLLGDEGSYFSDSPFGFGGVGGLGSLGGISQFGGGVPGGTFLPALNAFVTPNQTIPTANVPRVSNTTFSQVQYQLTPRSSWTAAVAYGLLRFDGAHYIDGNHALATAGYNYQLSPASSLALSYQFALFQFRHLAQGVDEHMVDIAYARRVTGRLALKLAAGPSLVAIREPLNGSARYLSWNANTALIYKLGRNTLSLTYDHFLTAGSGVLVGAQTDEVLGTFTRSFSQNWQAAASFGYASNRGLAQTTANAIEGRFNNWFGTIRVQHQFRPGMSFYAIFGDRLEGTCSASNCGSNFTSQTLSLGFNWNLRPIPLGR